MLLPELADSLAPPTKDFAFDYSKGQAFIYDGYIYYSPNCSRRVVIPPRDGKPKFEQPRLSTKMFRQPVRWSTNYGWLSFVPLAPSFVSLPFEPLCWMPRIFETTVEVYRNGLYRSETRFVMKAEDLEA
jgi:hypothetical protein